MTLVPRAFSKLANPLLCQGRFCFVDAQMRLKSHHQFRCVKRKPVFLYVPSSFQGGLRGHVWGSLKATSAIAADHVCNNISSQQIALRDRHITPDITVVSVTSIINPSRVRSARTNPTSNRTNLSSAPKIEHRSAKKPEFRIDIFD